MDQPDLSRASHAVLLLASHLGDSTEDADQTRIGPAAWYDVERIIAESPMDSPGELIHLPEPDWPEEVRQYFSNNPEIIPRLKRAGSLAMEIADFNDRGIWVTTKFEESYPIHFLKTLGRKAPPYLYISGSVDNLKPKAVSFVGSRDCTTEDKTYTQRVVRKAIEDGYSVVSGGARGIDTIAQEAGLDNDGCVVEFPAQGLGTLISKKEIREPISAGNLTLVSSYNPQASWTIGGAMGRNKYIHGFSSYSVVVRSGDESGGTWAGATENLQHGWSTVLVCTHLEPVPGNLKLIDMGAVSIDPTNIPEDVPFSEWVPDGGEMNRQGVDDPVSSSEKQLDLGDFN